MNSAVVRSFVNKSVGNIEEVKRESNDSRNPKHLCKQF